MILFNPLIFRRKKYKRYSSPHPAMPTKIYKDKELEIGFGWVMFGILVVVIACFCVGFFWFGGE